MKQIYLALVLSMLVAPTAFAGDNNCNGNNSCPQNTTNSNNTTNAGGAATIQSGAVVSNGGLGGQGGLGGAGGNASTGAISNNNTALGGVGFGGSASANGGSSSATIEKGAVTANGGNVIGSGNSANTVKTEVNTTDVNVNGQQQGQQQGQGQGQTQSANNEGNTQTINIAAPKTYRPPVNSAIAPTIFPTAPCMGSSSVGATGTLFSISGGTTWTSEECMILETARSFDQAGYAEDGLSVRCQGKWAKNAPSCKALAADAKQASALKTVKQATAPVVAKPTQRQAEVVVDSHLSNPVSYSDNGYYSTVTNPLAQ